MTIDEQLIAAIRMFVHANPWAHVVLASVTAGVIRVRDVGPGQVDRYRNLAELPDAQRGMLWNVHAGAAMRVWIPTTEPA